MNAVLFASPFQISGSVQLDSLASHNLIQSTKCFHTLTKEKFQCCCCCFLVGLFSPVAADERFEGKALSRPDWCPLSCVHYLGILSIMHVYNFTTNQLTFSLLPISSFFFVGSDSLATGHFISSINKETFLCLLNYVSFPCLLVIGNARKPRSFFCIVLICQHLNIELWFKTFVFVSIQDSESIDEIPEKREEEEQLNLQEMSEVISQGLLTFVEFKGLISNHCF